MTSDSSQNICSSSSLFSQFLYCLIRQTKTKSERQIFIKVLPGEKKESLFVNRNIRPTEYSFCSHLSCHALDSYIKSVRVIYSLHSKKCFEILRNTSNRTVPISWHYVCIQVLVHVCFHYTSSFFSFYCEGLKCSKFYIMYFFPCFLVLSVTVLFQYFSGLSPANLFFLFTSHGFVQIGLVHYATASREEGKGLPVLWKSNLNIAITLKQADLGTSLGMSPRLPPPRWPSG